MDLSSNTVKEKAFADQLRPEHRQFHLDTLAKIATGIVPVLVHERRIREAILKGQHQLRDCLMIRTKENGVEFSAKSQPRCYSKYFTILTIGSSVHWLLWTIHLTSI